MLNIASSCLTESTSQNRYSAVLAQALSKNPDFCKTFKAIFIENEVGRIQIATTVCEEKNVNKKRKGLGQTKGSLMTQKSINKLLL